MRNNHSLRTKEQSRCRAEEVECVHLSLNCSHQLGLRATRTGALGELIGVGSIIAGSIIATICVDA